MSDQNEADELNQKVDSKHETIDLWSSQNLPLSYATVILSLSCELKPRNTVLQFIFIWLIIGNFTLCFICTYCLVVHSLHCLVWVVYFCHFGFYRCFTFAIQPADCKRYNKKLSYRKDSARCLKRHSRSLKVIRCSANRRGMYDFLLALNSNLTSIFNCSWDITPSFHILSSRWNWKKMAGSRWTYFGAQNIGLSNHKLKSALNCTVW